ncbi:hypothetical protein QYE76_036234 [Lolium multiflorum]|uniref:BTB domain-containing protein n=1 Tax=Lolium multiflorum TaxID=4521 RepID=A0AAD8VP69_LOLMU|nr:hypothetical protein QYE76_036234 [Lolium multiflorum]
MASSSTNLTGAARAVELLKIDAYSASTTMGRDGCIKSRWNVGGCDWDIHLYPATSKFGIGYGEPLFPNPELIFERLEWGHSTRWVALDLVFLGEPRPRSDPIRATFACRLVDQSGVLQPSQERSVSREFNRPCACSAPVVLMERYDLPESGYLIGDSLAVECSITVLKELPVPTIPAIKVIPPLPPTNLHQHFSELLQSGTGADVLFIVSGESFAAHKLILSARSPVFMAEFFGEMKENSSWLVELEYMEAAVFKALLHFIYTDTVPELDQELEAVVTLAQHLLAAADSTLAILNAVFATEGYEHLAASCPLVLADLVKSLSMGESVDA